MSENRNILQSLTVHIVSDYSGINSKVPITILSLLLPIASELLSPSVGNAVGFPELMAVMSGLAAAQDGSGHLTLFPAALEVIQYTMLKNCPETAMFTRWGRSAKIKCGGK